MLATVIRDKYSLDETQVIADALEELCSPNDNYAWSSSGIYCFWHTKTLDILYIGLAVDLPFRFRQHNFLTECKPYCCKREQIQRHFASNEQLGYSIMVQSPLSQGICQRWREVNQASLEWITERFDFEDDEATQRALNLEIDEAIRTFEGALLRAHTNHTGRLPLWNRIQGARSHYSDGNLKTALYLMQSLTGSHAQRDPMTAHVRLRELAQSPTYEHFEELLHAQRFLMLSLGCDENTAYTLTHDAIGLKKRIEDSHYRERFVTL